MKKTEKNRIINIKKGGIKENEYEAKYDKIKLSKSKPKFKILFALLAVIYTLISINSVFALSVPKKQIVLRQGEFFPKVLKRGDEDQACATVLGEYEGKTYPAYCINMEKKGVGDLGIFNQKVELDGKITDNKAYRAVINGYPYKSFKELGVVNEKEAYCATKFAVWTMQNNLEEGYYSSLGTPESDRILNAYKKIVSDAKKDTRKIGEINISILEIDKDWRVVDKSFIEKAYKLEGTRDGVATLNLEGIKTAKISDLNGNVKKEFNTGESFKIRLDLKKLSKENELKIKVKAKLKTFPILYGRTLDNNFQNYAFSGLRFDAPMNLVRKINIISDTNLILNKIDAKTERKLEGVEFKIIDEYGKEQVLKTDNNGQIIISNIIPGKYKIIESKALEGYSKFDEEILVDINFNESKEINIRNNKIEIEENGKIESKKEYLKLPRTGC